MTEEITLEDVISRELEIKTMKDRFDNMHPNLKKAFTYLYKWIKSDFDTAYTLFKVFSDAAHDRGFDQEFLDLAIKFDPFTYTAYTAWEFGGDELLSQIKEYLVNEEEEEDEQV